MYTKIRRIQNRSMSHFSKIHVKIKLRKQITAILKKFTNEHITNPIGITYLNRKKNGDFNNLRNSLFIKYFIVKHFLAS